MNIDVRVKDNGKKVIHVTKSGTGVINPRGNRQFKYMKQNMFISEYNSSDMDKNHKRKFVVSIRLDGKDDDLGDYRLTQISFDESELRELKFQLDKLLG